MIDFLIYDVKVAALIAVFYMFYRLMLAHETFHRVNRLVLLLTALASFVLPLCVITMHETVVMDAVPMVTVGDVQMEIATEPELKLWQIVLPTLFIIGMVATLGHTLMSLFRILMLIKRSEKHPQADGTTICVSGNTDLAPFSWMHYIVMNRSDYEDRNEAILAHEWGHIRLKHSWDLLLVDLLTALQWFNPAMWMLRSDLRDIHEYEADGAVLSLGINARQYQYLLITKAASIGGYSLANGISHSTLKNRINMMLHKKSNRSSLLKLLALVPIIGTALALNARTVTDYVYDEPQKQQPVKKGRKAGTIKVGNQEIKVVEQDDIVTMEGEVEQNQAVGTFTPADEDKVFDVVEQMPEYPGGAKALLEYLQTNVRYPEEAEKQNIQGRVILTFVVGKDGSIRNTDIVKPVDPLLDAEALRVINAMPNWTPGRQNGEAVAVKYTVPVNFQLKSDDKPQATGSFTPSDEGGSAPKVEGVFKRSSDDPYIIVDGKPIDNATLKDIDPKTIDHIEVLKDKASIELYAEKGKNGVIIITTKEK